MSAEGEVSATAVNEGSFGLRIRTRYLAVVCRVEHQRAAARKQIRIDLEADRTGHLEYDPASVLVDVGLYSSDPQRKRILLGIPDKAIVRFRSEPPVQVVTVAHKKA